MTEQCGEHHPNPATWLRCEREPGHSGEHCSSTAALDVHVNWPSESDRLAEAISHLANPCARKVNPTSS